MVDQADEATSQEYNIKPLVDAAFQTIDKIPPNSTHNVVSAAYTKHKTIITAFNVTHFTGGPCAEQALFGAAAAQGYLPKDLRLIVAVVGGRRTVINPCGKCRQIMLDLL
jgi:cytidine deaminase